MFQGVAPKEMPSWMQFFYDKMKNPSQDYFNIKLFVAKLITNTAEVGTNYLWYNKLLHYFISINILQVNNLFYD